MVPCNAPLTTFMMFTRISSPTPQKPNLAVGLVYEGINHLSNSSSSPFFLIPYYPHHSSVFCIREPVPLLLLWEVSAFPFPFLGLVCLPIKLTAASWDLPASYHILYNCMYSKYRLQHAVSLGVLDGDGKTEPRYPN